uniref:NADH-ubiquinone oxidoreductase chain 4 n=1 Tax=Longicollum sp. (in: thorny-headed worms) TaxID=3073164 RepID=A0AA49K4Y4_9BILA|nr:NADH dehydrogenase subunit 4 [Longicollum sp. (in: thorny-headed worms)]
MMGGLLKFYEWTQLAISVGLLGVIFGVLGAVSDMGVYGVGFSEVGGFSVLLVLLVGLTVIGVMMGVDSGLGLMGQGFSLLLMAVLMVGFFIFDSWLWFYVSYEGVLVPLLVVVVVWGVYYERVGSCLYLILYTALFSVPLLVMVLLGLSSGLVVWLHDSGGLVLSGVGGGLVCILLGAMLVKVPVYGLHMWLPKVHVEAPTWGSMVLAGVVIKLGGYGMGVMEEAGLGGWVVLLIGVWAVVGGCISGLYCLMVGDVKSMVAYSSVVHMALLIWLLGFMSSGVWWGVLVVVVVHGLVSMAMFSFVGGCSESKGSRSVVVLKGVVSMLSFSGALFMLMVVWNMGFPLSAGVVGEVQGFYYMMMLGAVGVVMMGVYMVVGCLFSLWLGVMLSGGLVGEVSLKSGASSLVEAAYLVGSAMVLLGVVMFI